jgi:hypothetical protein
VGLEVCFDVRVHDDRRSRELFLTVCGGFLRKDVCRHRWFAS